MSLHALPLAGGLDDQPAGMIERMIACHNAWTATRAYRMRDVNHHKEWVDANPDLMAIVERIRKLRAKEAENARI